MSSTGFTSDGLVDFFRRDLASTRGGLPHLSMTRPTHARALAWRLALVLSSTVSLAGFFAGCGSPTPPAPVAAVTLDPVTATLVPDETVQLTATVNDASGTSLYGRMISWSSSATPVATVSSGGLMTAITLGYASITATSEGNSVSVAITVNDGRLVTAAGGTVIALRCSTAVGSPAPGAHGRSGVIA